MADKVNLLYQVYNKNQFSNTIDTAFSQLPQAAADQTSSQATPTRIQNFFSEYQALFYDIPKSGSNSHQTLINQSTNYVGKATDSELVKALKQEIDTLRTQLVQQQQLITTIQNITGSK